MFSIDQNCHSLWDVLPKLQALRAHGYDVTHFIEDADVAFTAIGTGGQDRPLGLARERFYRSGGADWGAALFYTEFLGRQPTDIRDWAPAVGMKISALGRQLHTSADDLYDRYSPSDNWQLIGPSYVGDRWHHRTIADLTVREVAPHLRELMATAERDCRRAFPAEDSQKRLEEWFARERSLVEGLIETRASDPLVELYRAWLAERLGETVPLRLGSQLFALGADRAREGLIERFLLDYDQAAGLYNEAIRESGCSLRPLDTKRGELPVFAVLDHQGRSVRCGLFLDADRLRAGEREFALSPERTLPVEAMRRAGIRALPGKAVLLVLQVRLGEKGQVLALPYRGSPYMPAAHALARKLKGAGLLPGALKGVYRVRFRLLDRLRSLKTPIRLPAHLRRCFADEVVPARALGEQYAALAAEAAERLETLRDDPQRRQWQRRRFADLFEQIDRIDDERRELARTDPKSQRIRDLSSRSKQLQLDVLRRTVEQVAADHQLAQIDYYDSRGALWPWCLALGGEEFYRQVIDQAEVYEETPSG